MSVLSGPRHPLIDQALTDAAHWCAGHVIDDRPALAHAVHVAVTVGRHLPHAEPHMLAAALLHDAPEFAPPLLRIDRDQLYALLTHRYGPDVARIIAALDTEHATLGTPHPLIPAGDLPVLLVSTADKIVALRSLIIRARRSGDIDAFFDRRGPLLTLIEHFRAFHHAGLALVPARMSADLHHAIQLLDRTTAPARRRAGLA